MCFIVHVCCDQTCERWLMIQLFAPSPARLGLILNLAVRQCPKTVTMFLWPAAATVSACFPPSLEYCTPSSSMTYMSACVTMMRREAPLSDQSPPSPQIRAKTLRGAAHNSSQLRRVTSVTPWHAVITQPGIDNHITREHAPAVLTKSGLN